MKWHLILPGDWFVLGQNPFLSLLTRISLLQSRTQTVSQSLFIYVLNRCLAVAAKWDYYTPACQILSNCSFHKYCSSTNLYICHLRPRFSLISPIAWNIILSTKAFTIFRATITIWKPGVTVLKTSKKLLQYYSYQRFSHERGSWVILHWASFKLEPIQRGVDGLQ